MYPSQVQMGKRRIFITPGLHSSFKPRDGLVQLSLLDQIGADIVVNTTKLTSVQAIQIKDIMINDAGIASDKIKIVEVG